MSGAPQIRLRTFANFQHKLMPRSHKAVSRVANRKAMEYHWKSICPSTLRREQVRGTDTSNDVPSSESAGCSAPTRPRTPASEN